ncbi:hypothetical protein C1H46_020580 [Malus baccata]|uniref:O-methyltransferase C-terminal domain-containing protein n=1 Tax=Malus baccata TaxID=106549 RepID=A0A540M535_MALBA|nr:hypothetical protein C1H46_020580 [Malus baccata]
MFASVPSGDAIFKKVILHDWRDQHCLKLLENCYNAIPDVGKVIIVEALLPVMPETSTAVKSTSQMDVLMMTQNQGGKERSREEFMALATASLSLLSHLDSDDQPPSGCQLRRPPPFLRLPPLATLSPPGAHYLTLSSLWHNMTRLGKEKLGILSSSSVDNKVPISFPVFL